MVTIFNFHKRGLLIVLCVYLLTLADVSARADGVEAAIRPLADELLQNIANWRTDRGAGGHGEGCARYR